MTSDKKSKEVVIRYEKKKGRNPEIQKAYVGYDIKSGNRLIEVKPATRSYFDLTEPEYKAMSKNKNYWVYLVNLKTKKIFAILNRNEILKRYSRPYTRYAFKTTPYKK